MAQYNIVGKFGVFTDTNKKKYKNNMSKKVSGLIHGFSGAGSCVFAWFSASLYESAKWTLRNKL